MPDDEGHTEAETDMTTLETRNGTFSKNNSNNGSATYRGNPYERLEKKKLKLTKGKKEKVVS